MHRWSYLIHLNQFSAFGRSCFRSYFDHQKKTTWILDTCNEREKYKLLQLQYTVTYDKSKRVRTKNILPLERISFTYSFQIHFVIIILFIFIYSLIHIHHSTPALDFFAVVMLIDDTKPIKYINKLYMQFR